MKNFLLSILLIAALAGILQLFLPWWIIAPVAFVVALLIKQSGWMAFASGFLAIFLLWVVYAFTLSSANDNILVSKVAVLLKAITQGSAVGLYLFTGLIGGLTGGFGALTGSQVASLK